ncbi:MAG: hypothetical protein Q8N45_10015, partial [Anaerolineales bacterium]|nr:hypothetical protein [Anaerolineales bacterium]
ELRTFDCYFRQFHGKSGKLVWNDLQIGQFLGLDQIATRQIQVVQEKVGIYGGVEIHDLAKNFSEWTVKSRVISAFRSDVVFQSSRRL